MITYLYAIIFIVVLDFLWSQYLSYCNRKRMSTVIPYELVGIYNQTDYTKQQEYQKINSRFSLYSNIFSTVLILVVLVLGGFGWLDMFLRHYITDSPILLTLVFFGIIYIVNTILSIPFDYYSTFVIEERFGFNKSTRTTFWLDQIKGLFLSVLLGGAILALITWFFTTMGMYAWVYAWGVVIAFSLFMLLFYSNLIVPLFNKQKPLEAGELRDAIEAFAQKAGFEIKNIYVMDASKRSTKANAYFTGLGSKKRIVLYDTLINDLSTDEIVAVLAHEIGHYKYKHTLSSMLFSIFTTGLMLFLLSFFIHSQYMAYALGTTYSSFHIGVIAFSLLFSPLSLLLNIFSNKMSRKNEYQADAYAASFGLAESLINGLKKLSIKSLSNLNPDPLYVYFYYSHPTLLQRIDALRVINTEINDIK